MAGVSGIYRYVNLVNGKSYVGKSVDLHHRHLEHMRYLRAGTEPCVKLNRAWQKYGEDNFQYEILCYCNREDLNDMEREYISKFDSFRNGYNCTEGGDGMQGFHHTEESKKRIGDAFRGREISDAQRKLLSDVQKGKTLTAEHRAALSAAWTEEQKQWLSNTRSGAANPNFGKRGASACNIAPIVCSTGEFFFTLRDAAKWCGLASTGNLVSCCKGKQRTCGRHPDTKEKLTWRYATNDEIEANKT